MAAATCSSFYALKICKCTPIVVHLCQPSCCMLMYIFKHFIRSTSLLVSKNASYLVTISIGHVSLSSFLFNLLIFNAPNGWSSVVTVRPVYVKIPIYLRPKIYLQDCQPLKNGNVAMLKFKVAKIPQGCHSRLPPLVILLYIYYYYTYTW